jgi:hypothetical protein
MLAGSDASTAALQAEEGDKWEPGAWGITEPPHHWGNINTETWSSKLGVGHKADNLAL